MDTVALPPDLEQFVAQSVAAGEFRDPAEMVAAGIRLLQEQHAARAAFVRSLEEAERDGWLSLDEVMADADAVLSSMTRAV